MSLAWLALLEEGTWRRPQTDNPFTSLASLHGDLTFWYHRDDASRREERLAIVRDVVGHRVEELLPTVDEGPPRNLREGRWAVSRLSEVVVIPPELSRENALAIAPPPKAGAWLRLLAERAGSEPLATLARELDTAASYWAVGGIEAFTGTSSAVQLPGLPDALMPTARPLELDADEQLLSRHPASTRILWDAAALAAAGGTPLSLGQASDVDVLSVLWAVGRLARAPGQMLLRFKDASVATFPVRPITDASPLTSGARVVDSGLMSLRHGALDCPCSFYWFRNERLSSRDRLADAFYVAAQDAGQRIRDLALGRQPLSARLHLTGFHPAVAGLVAAISEYAQVDGGIEVVPVSVQGDPLPQMRWRVGVA